MQIQFDDAELVRIRPSTLSDYAESIGWRPDREYRRYSTIYVGKNLPEIIIPDTAELGDYATAVADLIEEFSEALNLDLMAVYQSLTESDRDVIRLRAREVDGNSIGLEQFSDLVRGSKELIQAAVWSLEEVQPYYLKSGASQDSKELLREMRMGQTERGSYVVNIMTPELRKSLPQLGRNDGGETPKAREMTTHLAQALHATRDALDEAADGNTRKLFRSYESGLNANHFNALSLMVKDTPELDISFAWASSSPVKMPPSTVRFQSDDKELLQKAAASLRKMTSDDSV